MIKKKCNWCEKEFITKKLKPNSLSCSKKCSHSYSAYKISKKEFDVVHNKKCIICNKPFFVKTNPNHTKTCGNLSCRRKLRKVTEKKYKSINDKKYYQRHRDRIILKQKEYYDKTKQLKSLNIIKCLNCNKQFKQRISFQKFCSNRCAIYYSDYIINKKRTLRRMKKNYEKYVNQENIKRKEIGIPLVGELRYVNEIKLKRILDEIFPNELKLDNKKFIIFGNKLKKQATRFGALELDRYYPNLKLAFEYQGEQHFKPVRFGGVSLNQAKENYEKQVIRDKKTREMCNLAGIRLIEIFFLDKLDINNIKKIISFYN